MQFKAIIEPSTEQDWEYFLKPRNFTRQGTDFQRPGLGYDSEIRERMQMLLPGGERENYNRGAKAHLIYLSRLQRKSTRPRKLSHITQELGYEEPGAVPLLRNIEYGVSHSDSGLTLHRERTDGDWLVGFKGLFRGEEFHSRRARVLAMARDDFDLHGEFEDVIFQIVLLFEKWITGYANSFHLEDPDTVEDLVQVGRIALFVQLRDTYDPARNRNIKTVGGLRVKGAMQDVLRGIDKYQGVSRSVRTVIKQLTPDDLTLSIDELATQLGRNRDTVYQAVNIKAGHKLSSIDKPAAGANSKTAIDANKNGSVADVTPDDIAADPDWNMMDDAFWIEVAKGCSEEEGLILELYYRKGLTMRQIGRKLKDRDLSESRISQIHTSLTLKMGKALLARQYRAVGEVPPDGDTLYYEVMATRLLRAMGVKVPAPGVDDMVG